MPSISSIKRLGGAVGRPEQVLGGDSMSGSSMRRSTASKMSCGMPASSSMEKGTSGEVKSKSLRLPKESEDVEESSLSLLEVVEEEEDGCAGG